MFWCPLQDHRVPVMATPLVISPCNGVTPATFQTAAVLSPIDATAAQLDETCAQQVSGIRATL
jgi:hypothetical protein